MDLRSVKSQGQSLPSAARVLRRLGSSRLALAMLIVIAALALARGLNLAVFDSEGGKDFQWSGSRTLLDHRNPYAEYQEYRQGLREKPFILTQAPNYPASGYVFLWPFAALEWSAAKAAWAVANVCFTI